VCRAEKEASGISAFSQSSCEAASMSASSAADVADHVKGSVPRSDGAPVGCARRARALTSKGSKGATAAVSEKAADEKRGACEADERLARAERRLASRAGTGLTHPWSSVEPRLVEPAPVDASAPAQSRCCFEGFRG
jgi:hypothetical protein